MQTAVCIFQMHCGAVALRKALQVLLSVQAVSFSIKGENAPKNACIRQKKELQVFRRHKRSAFRSRGRVPLKMLVSGGKIAYNKCAVRMIRCVWCRSHLRRLWEGSSFPQLPHLFVSSCLLYIIRQGNANLFHSRTKAASENPKRLFSVIAGAPMPPSDEAGCLSV